MDASAANALTDQLLVSDRDHAAAVTFFNSCVWTPRFDTEIPQPEAHSRRTFPYHGTLACAAPQILEHFRKAAAQETV